MRTSTAQAVAAAAAAAADIPATAALQDRTNLAVTASIAELGRQLGLVVVAEGVETAEQRDRVLALGCHVAHG